jgi:hypothetical protein
MRTIQTLAGTPLVLDGDVLAVIETVSRDLLRGQELNYGFEDVDRAFLHLVSEMTEDDLRAYLKESLFMSFNRYESELMSGLVKRAAQAAAPPRRPNGRGRAAGRRKAKARRPAKRARARKTSGRRRQRSGRRN